MHKRHNIIYEETVTLSHLI